MKIKDLTKGNISKLIIMLSLPMLANGLLDMMYNVVDMFWIAKINSDAVASVGTAGFFIWAGFTIGQLISIGTQVKSSQEIGKEDFKKALLYQRTGLQLAFIIGAIYALMIFIFNKNLIGIFNIESAEVVKNARSYLYIVSIFIPFIFMNIIYASIYNSKGLSLIPLKVSAVSIVINIILDPIFIFNFNLGVKGAGIATLIATGIQFTTYTIYTIRKEDIINIGIFSKIDKKCVKEILKLGFPPFVFNFVHLIVAIVLTRIVSKFGAEAIAVQKVGSQMESISWGTAVALSVAVSSFTGQNVGAKKFRRVREGYNKTLLITLSISCVAFLAFVFLPEILLSPFFGKEPEVMLLGVSYFHILSIALLFQGVEIMTAGAFNGLGKTKPPAIISIIFNLLRIPLALYLSQENMLGLEGIWWAISISTIFKGTIMVASYKFTERKLLRENNVV